MLYEVITVMEILNGPELLAYRNAIVSKKLASLAFYRFGQNWEKFAKELEKDFSGSLYKSLSNR